MNIGANIKQIRNSKNVSLTALAKTSGVQIATLSRMEHGKMTGTVESHLNIAKALNIDITDLYHGLQQPDSLTPASEEAPGSIATPNDKSSYEILTRQVTTKRMLPLLIKIDAKGSTNEEKLAHHAERFLYVLDGTVIVTVKGQTVKLKENTSLYFNASSAHMITNAGEKTARILSITTPVSL
ncbi:MAG: helix-turn-helix transcriptional regulator [Candidatus Omnitrophica bacterium]|nr:helix-turn-helix transcriptional regulator [Candidatus Omnitrophota bacterium]